MKTKQNVKLVNLLVSDDWIGFISLTLLYPPSKIMEDLSIFFSFYLNVLCMQYVKFVIHMQWLGTKCPRTHNFHIFALAHFANVCQLFEY